MIFTVALVVPNLALENESLDIASPLPPSVSHYALEAPRTSLPTLADYAEAAAEETGIDETKFKKLIGCESRWKEDALGDNGTSHGILQFKEATFDLFAKKYSIAKPDITDPYQQIDLAAQMLRDGYLEHWRNCTRKIGWVNGV